ncbi:hypothetical protein AMTR_s00001p00272240 [Amborella trichopoda]|uniref:Uncharacterized protein n=1 Tax=Amborella trichopoda TaxID=13333 RepID=W1NM89_AMBTC|nr:hypothetical protein AMTR_s00001p00272240 [Amborella trichopoda]
MDANQRHTKDTDNVIATRSKYKGGRSLLDWPNSDPLRPPEFGTKETLSPRHNRAIRSYWGRT